MSMEVAEYEDLGRSERDPKEQQEETFSRSRQWRGWEGWSGDREITYRDLKVIDMMIRDSMEKVNKYLRDYGESQPSAERW